MLPGLAGPSSRALSRGRGVTSRPSALITRRSSGCACVVAELRLLDPTTSLCTPYAHLSRLVDVWRRGVPLTVSHLKEHSRTWDCYLSLWIMLYATLGDRGLLCRDEFMTKGGVPGSMLSCLRGAGSLAELGAVAAQNIQPRPRAHTDNPIWPTGLCWLLRKVVIINTHHTCFRWVAMIVP